MFVTMAKLKTQRESNIELLRIITAMGVIVLHYNNAGIGGAYKAVAVNSGSAWMLYFLEALFICAVDLFVMLLGYFQSTKRSVNAAKPVLLLMQVSIVRLIAYLAPKVVSGGAVSLKGLFSNALPINHFIAVYCTVFLLSPYINLLLDRLNRKRKWILAFVLIFLFSLHPTALDVMRRVGFDLNGMSTISNAGSGAGYTVVNYVFMYILGALAREITLGKKSIALFFACQLSLFGLEAVAHIYGISIGHLSYCNPLVIGCAFFALQSFKMLPLGTRPWINELASGSLMVYLTHKRLFPLFHISEAAANGGWALVLNLVMTCLVCYLAGWVFHKLYGLLFGPLIACLTKIMKKWNIDTSEE